MAAGFVLFFTVSWLRYISATFKKKDGNVHLKYHFCDDNKHEAMYTQSTTLSHLKYLALLVTRLLTLLAKLYRRLGQICLPKLSHSTFIFTQSPPPPLLYMDTIGTESPESVRFVEVETYETPLCNRLSETLPSVLIQSTQ